MDLTALFAERWFLGDFLRATSTVINLASLELSIRALLLTADHLMLLSPVLYATFQ